MSGDRNTVEFLLEIIKEERNIPEDDPDFGPDVDLFYFEYLDSFGIVNLIEKVEEAYGVDLTNVDFYSEGLRSVRGLAAHIDGQHES